MSHKHPIGSLVEMLHGPRLWVVHHVRDCDHARTPLYCLSVNPNDTNVEREGFFNDSWVTGIPEESLTFIRMVDAPPSDGNWQSIETAPRDGTTLLLCGVGALDCC